MQVKFEGPAWSGVSDTAKDLIGKMLDRDYNSRITATQALQHPWIKSHCGDTECIFQDDAVDMSPDDLSSLRP